MHTPRNVGSTRTSPRCDTQLFDDSAGPAAPQGNAVKHFPAWPPLIREPVNLFPHLHPYRPSAGPVSAAEQWAHPCPSLCPLIPSRSSCSSWCSAVRLGVTNQKPQRTPRTPRKPEEVSDACCRSQLDFTWQLPIVIRFLCVLCVLCVLCGGSACSSRPSWSSPAVFPPPRPDHVSLLVNHPTCV